jgi:mRNA interferase MazF
VVAQITTALRRIGDKSNLLIETATQEGKQAGLLHDSVVSCNNLATIKQSLIHKVIGTLAQQTMQTLSICLKAALDIG